MYTPHHCSLTIEKLCVNQVIAEPPVTDPPNRGPPLYNGQSWTITPTAISHRSKYIFMLLNSGHPPNFRQQASAANLMTIFYLRSGQVGGAQKYPHNPLTVPIINPRRACAGEGYCTWSMCLCVCVCVRVCVCPQIRVHRFSRQPRQV